MSIATCDRCSGPVDTDSDPDCYYNPMQECVCEQCREIQWESDNEGYINE